VGLGRLFKKVFRERVELRRPVRQKQKVLWFGLAWGRGGWQDGQLRSRKPWLVGKEC